MKGVSASKAGLLPHCQYPFRDGTPWEYTKSAAAEKGQRFHDAIACVVDEDIPKPTGIKGTGWLLDRMKVATAWLDSQTFPTRLHAELAFAYDPETGAGRILGKNIGRRYKEHGQKPHELAGSADFLFVHEGTVYVYDWKTGKSVTDSVWAQMEWLGLFAARAHGVEHVVLRPLHVTDYGIEDSMVQELFASQLAMIAADIRRDVAAIPDSWPEPGPHCDEHWCPTRKSCGLYQIRKAG